MTSSETDGVFPMFFSSGIDAAQELQIHLSWDADGRWGTADGTWPNFRNP